jgi:8-amino-7-oxononanoate synthase
VTSGDVSARLKGIRDAGLYRELREITGEQGPRVDIAGRNVLLLCSNNYLGLASDPRVKQAAADAALQFGASAGASRSVSGTMTIHQQLEAQLADFKGNETALLFGSGYLANIGVISALAPDGVVFSDELNHASIIDGCRLAKAKTFIYRHRDLEHLAEGLAAHDGAPAVIVTDSVFSMDGDIAPLKEIAQLARRHGAKFVVDEAHGTGCLGPGGRGALAADGVNADVIVGTLGKSLGSYGAYAVCSSELRELLINSARSFIFATAPAPPAVAAASAALAALRAEPERVDRLQANAELLRQSLASAGLRAESSTQILPLLIGEPEAALKAAQIALDRGVYAQAIRPPTVPDGTSRLRLTVMATHEEQDLINAAGILAEAAG